MFLIFSYVQFNQFKVTSLFLFPQTIEDFILLIGTSVAFIAFILWCCFPIVPKDGPTPNSTNADSRYFQYKKVDGSYDDRMYHY
jgi:hypothetical protein